MKPVMQTVFPTEDGKVRGNCMAAAVASLLELDISEVPNFMQQADDQRTALTAVMREWLRPRGYGLIWWEAPAEGPVLEYNFSAVCCYFIAVGASPRGHGSHAVVGYGNDLVHDPHPDGTFLNGYPAFFYIITPFFKPGQDYKTGDKMGSGKEEVAGDAVHD